MSFRHRKDIPFRKVVSFLAVFALLLFSPSLGQTASPPNLLTYQGRLLDSNGVPVTDASASMIFELYTASSGGTCVWSNSSATCASSTARTVTLTDGLFSENLGDTTLGAPYAAIGDSIFADNGGLYLQVTVEGETLSPRKALTSAPYALNSETLDGLSSADFLQVSNDLSDLSSVATARTNLGLGSLAVLSSVDISDNTNLVAGTNLTLTGDTLDVDDAFVLNTGDTLTGAFDLTGAVLLGGSALVFEGATADDFETTFAFIDPTADRTITFQNASGTVALTSNLLWEVGTGGSYEDDAAVIVGADTTFDYLGGGVGDLLLRGGLEARANSYFENDVIIGAGTSSTETLANTGFVLDGDDLFVAGMFGVEGSIYSDGSVILGQTTALSDGSLDSTGAFSFNTVNNQAITTGTGLFTTGGAFTAFGNVILGSGTSNTLTLSGTVQGATPLVFEGATADNFETTFFFTDPTADRTVTFQNVSGTVALLADLTSDLITLDSVYDAGGSGVGRSITADSGAVSISNSALDSGELFSVVHSVSGDLQDSGDTQNSFGTQRTLTSTSTVNDDMELLNITRQTTVDNAGATYNSQGAVLVLRNMVTQTAGTINDSTHVLEIEQSALSTGGAIRVVSGSTFLGDDLVVGDLALSETISHGGFALDGDDAFIVGDVGIEGNIFTDGSLVLGDADADTFAFSGNTFDLTGSAPVIDATTGALGLNTTSNQDINTGTGGFDIGGHAAIGGGASVGALTTLSVSDSLACTSTCVGTNVSLANTTSSFTSYIVGVNATASTSVVGGAGSLLLGSNSNVATTADVESAYAARFGFSTSSGSPTIGTLKGGFSYLDLDGVTNVTNTVTGIESVFDLNTSTTFTGTASLFKGSYTGTAGTFPTFYGSEMRILPTGGVLTNVTGSIVDINPGGTASFTNSATGIDVDIDGDNVSGNDIKNAYGVDIAVVSGTTGTTVTYGLRATASGADTNYAGYFYDSLVQIDGDNTPDTNNALATGAGDLYVTSDIEADGDVRIDGGDLALNNTSGNALAVITAANGGTDGYAGVKLVGANDWFVYTAETSATIVNGAAADLRWSTDSLGGDDEMRLTSTGDLFVDGDITTLNGTVSSGANAADLAEVYAVSESGSMPGDILSINDTGDIVLGRSEYALFGVVSTRPGFLLDSVGGDVPVGSQPVALSGRVPTKVNLEGGMIAPGDPITVSSVPGVGKKATALGMVVGYALEGEDGSGDGVIDVFVNLAWNPGGQLAADETSIVATSDIVLSAGDASAGVPAVNSSSLTLRGSAFDGDAMNRSFSISSDVGSATEYRLSIKNSVDAEVAYVDQDGGFSVAGDVIVGDHLYPSDRGTPQANRYIFYDGSSGGGGDFMRTNAAGWATGSYDFAEMFPSSQKLEPGDVVVFGSQKESVERGVKETRAKIAGVVSTRPGFLAGENKPGDYPIALAGRVPTKVSDEGGEINIGDPLTVSSVAGVAKKAKEAGMILGYALENFTGTSGKIIAFINATYWNGGAVAAKTSLAGPTAATFSQLNLSSDLYIGSNNILNVGAISGIGQVWEITSSGTVRVRGVLATAIEGYNGELIDTYAVTSPEVTVTLAGTATLQSGRATVNLVEEDARFLMTVSNQVPLRILASPSASVAVYVTNRTKTGFDIVQVGGASSGVDVDWYVIGVRKDFEAEEELIIETPADTEEQVVDETDGLDLVEEAPEGGVSTSDSNTEVEESVSYEEEKEVNTPEEEEVFVEEVVEDEEVSVEEVSAEEETAEEVGVVDEPASTESPLSESEQIPVEPSHEDAEPASEGSLE